MYTAVLPAYSPQIIWLTNAFSASHPVSFTPEAVTNPNLIPQWVLTKACNILYFAGHEEV